VGEHQSKAAKPSLVSVIAPQPIILTLMTARPMGTRSVRQHRAFPAPPMTRRRRHVYTLGRSATMRLWFAQCARPPKRVSRAPGA
jgi:hypothetical protein